MQENIIKKRQKISYINKECEISEDASYYDTYKSDSALESALNCLDFDLRTITVLFYYDNLSIQDISDILKIPEGTVKSRLSRAREKLFKILSEGGENDG